MAFPTAYVNNLKKYPPAFTAGLMIFLVFIGLLQLIFPGMGDSLSLKSTTLTNFELNSLSFYPVVHMNLLHLLFNLVSLYPLVRAFELENGTVRTGIILNVLAVVPGLAYCILSLITGSTTSVLGSSGWCFSLLGYFSLKQFRHTPTLTIAQNVTVPTWTLPFIPLILVGIFIPQSSFLGHVLGLGGGWLLEMGYLNFMFVKSTNVVEWIETKIARVIALIPSQLDYITEVRARDIRSSGSAGLPVVNEPSAFQGPGHQLGQV